MIRIAHEGREGLTPPVETAELLLHVPSRSVTLLAAPRSPWAATRGRAGRERRARNARNASIAGGGWAVGRGVAASEG